MSIARGLEQKLEQHPEIKMDKMIVQSQSVSSVGFFSLKEICMNDLLSNEHIVGKEYVEQLRTKNSDGECSQLYDEYRQFKQEKLKSLLEAILRGDPDAAREISEKYPILLLEKLAEEECAVAPSGQKANAKPYQIALATEDTQMASMLKAQLLKVADEKEATAQFNEQFPEGWKEAENNKWIPIFNQLDSLTQTIRDAQPGDIISSGQPEYKLTVREESKVAIALAQFRSMLEAMLDEIATIGRHFNLDLLQKAFQIYNSHYQNYFGNDSSDPRAMLFWQQIIGYIQRVLPANYAQAFCDGLCNTTQKLQKGIPQSRSFKFEILNAGRNAWCPSDFYPLASSLLGFDFAIYGRQAGCGAARKCASRSNDALLNLLSIKNNMHTELNQHQNGQSEVSGSSCLVM